MQEHLAFHAVNTKEHDQRSREEVDGVLHGCGLVAITAANNRGDETVFLDSSGHDQDDQEVRS